nr:HLA class II histocompatibility antigen, DQ alpha 2 chain-like [Anolis sagrei ordinatus]
MDVSSLLFSSLLFSSLLFSRFPTPCSLVFFSAAEADYVGLRFFQENFPAGPKAAETEAGEYLDEFEGEAIFQVDWAQKTTSWRLPDFARFATFESTIALRGCAL